MASCADDSRRSGTGRRVSGPLSILRAASLSSLPELLRGAGVDKEESIIGLGEDGRVAFGWETGCFIEKFSHTIDSQPVHISVIDKKEG